MKKRWLVLSVLLIILIVGCKENISNEDDITEKNSIPLVNTEDSEEYQEVAYETKTETQTESDLHKFYDCIGNKLVCVEGNLRCVRDDGFSVVDWCLNGCSNSQCIGREFQPFTGSCIEAVAGHNNLQENRINVIVVGVGYENFNFFKFLVDSIIDFDSDYYGLLSLEPFKSNLDKFNFWYIDEIQNVDSFYDNGIYYYNYIRDKIKKLPLPCQYPNQQFIVVYEGVSGMASISESIAYAGITDQKVFRGQFPDCSSSDLNNDGCVNGDDLDILEAKGLEIPSFNECRQAHYGCQFSSIPQDDRVFFYLSGLGVAIHEFGHSFGHLQDEYDSVSAAGEHPFTYGENCFVAKTESECLDNAPWRDLIGQGCGDERILDCNSNDKDYTLEVGCFEGCGFHKTGVYRPSMGSIMGTQESSISNDWFTPYYSFKLVNERLLCNRISEETGSAEGYCQRFQ